MEKQEFNYLGFREVEGWLWWWCEELEKDIPYQIQKKIYKEIKQMEKMQYKGWIAYTKIKNNHIMLMLGKLGAEPYRIDIKEKNIWFKKEY